jgi:hypothetical protein
MTEQPQARITSRLIFIPPYLSATWSEIRSLRVDRQNGDLTLQVTLADGHTVAIPHLDEATVEKAFAEHVRFIEEREETPPPSTPASFDSLMGMPIAVDFSGDMESMSGVLQHNPAQSNAPALPSDVLNKIATIAQAVGGNLQEMPPFELNCNCLYCQIARALQVGAAASEEGPSEEEEVSADELQFRSWDIEQTGDKLYRVINPLDRFEEYQVFLGDPIGCTCGHKHCDHIRAVLSS